MSRAVGSSPWRKCRVNTESGSFWSTGPNHASTEGREVLRDLVWLGLRALPRIERNGKSSWLRLSALKTLSPRLTFRPGRDKWGMGVRQSLFPGPALGAHPCGGCRFPDAILHGKRSFRPRSRAVRRLAVARFRVRLFSSLRRMVAPPACEPGQDTPVIVFSRLDRLAPGQPPLLTARSPGATGLASSLSGCLLLTVQRRRF